MRRLLVLLLVFAGLGVVARGAVPCDAFGLQPRCYVTLNPGPTSDTLEIVSIDGTTTYSSGGELLLTTVAVDSDLDLWEWVTTAFSSRVQQVDRELIFPPGQDEEDVRLENVMLMENSQLDATIAALRSAGFSFDTDFDGAEVVELADTTAFDEGVIQVGDVIVEVDGVPVTDNGDLVEAVRTKSVDDPITIGLLRGDERHTVTFDLVESDEVPGQPVIGVIVTSYLELPIHVDIDAGNVGGPSAGLMFALAISDLLEPGDLTDGHVIAGTGVIDRDGNVGPIGGIQQKILGAIDRGQDQRPATVFLTPVDNFDEASRTPIDRDVLLVPVATLQDALQALADLRSGQQPEGALALPAA